MGTPPSTRHLLVRLLRESGGATLADLRTRTSLSRSVLRKHLGYLARAGLVESHFLRRPTGRPPRVYRLTARPRPMGVESYVDFLRTLVRWLQTDGEEGADEVFTQVARGVAARYPEIRTLPNVASRLAAARRLFFGEETSTAGEPANGDHRFSLHVCPLGGMALEVRDLCGLTRAILAELTGADVEQEEWISRGDPACTFIVRSRQMEPPLAVAAAVG